MLINGFDPNDLPQTLVYDGDNLSYIQVQVPNGEGETITYRRTFTYTSGKVTAVSGWDKQ